MTTMTSRGEAGEIRRPLSPMERWYWICDQISPLNVIARVHVAGSCTPQDLRWASARLADEHPLLRVAVTAGPDGTRPRFVAAPNPRIPVRTIYCDGPAVDRWEREVDGDELVTSLDWREGPLARIIDVAHGPAGTEREGHDLLLTMSHVIADTTAAMELLRRLVELAAGRAGAAAVAGPAPPASRSREPVPPTEELLPKRINKVPRAAHLIGWIIADRIALALARPGRLTPAVAVPPARRRTRLIRHELDATQLDQLTARCRRETVTLHSALAAAMALAASGSVTSKAITGRKRRATAVTIGSPVDFRADLVPPVGRQDAGAYAAAVPEYVRVGPDADLWTAARGAVRALRRRKRFRHQLALVSMLRFMCPPSVGRSTRTVALVDRVGPGNICLSDIECDDFPDRIGRWQLSGAQFVSGISVNGYLTATVTTSHGALHWNFTYIEDAVPRERAQQIASQAVRILLCALGLDQTKPVAEGTRREEVAR